MRTYDGLNPDPARVTYDYGTRCYDQKGGNTNGGALCRGDHAGEVGPLVGHDTVTVTAFDYDDTPLVTTTHRYYIDNDHRWKRGREWQSQVYSGQDELLRQTDTTWINTSNGRTGFAYVSRVVTTDYSGGGQASTKAEYKYEEAEQGNAQYGNLTHVYEYADASATAPYRTTRTTYIPNPSGDAWIVSKARLAQVFEGDENGREISRVEYYYDRSSEGLVRGWDDEPVEGNLVQEDHIYLGDPSRNVRTEYWYDDWGNLTGTADALGHHTVTQYDDTYHVFPIQTCGAAGTDVELCSQTEYYTAGEEGGLPGQVKSVIDPNGVATGYRYDGFGRLAKVVRPHDTEMLPTVEYWYDETTSPDRPVHEYYSAIWKDTLHNSPANHHLPDAEYVFRRTHFRILPTQQPGTKPLYRFWYHDEYNRRYYHDTMYTTDPDDGLGSKWESQGVVGYVWNDPGPGRQELWRCKDQAHQRMDHSLAVGNEACPYGGKDKFLGYVLPGDGVPLRVVAFQREVSGQAGTLNSYTYYDGWGREIQTRTEAPENAPKPWGMTGHTDYDALGRAVRSYTPAFRAQSEYSDPYPDWLYSETTYDALGRAVRVVNPDGTSSSAVHGGRMQIAEDANRHVKLSFSDGFGRLTAVDETALDWSDDFEDGALTDWSIPTAYNGKVQEAGGVMRISGIDTYDGNGICHQGDPLGDDEGVLITFKYDPGGIISQFALLGGTWGKDSFRSWGLNVWQGVIELLAYDGTDSYSVPLLPVRTGVWYRGLLKVGGDGEYIAAVWERDNPALRGEWREDKGSGWAGNGLLLHTKVKVGAAEIDDYSELAFHTTHYAYDALDNLMSVTDTLENVTTMTYDALGRKTKMSDPDMGVWTYTYDKNGNLETQTDAKGQMLWFKYDPLNRLEEKRLDGSSGTLLAQYIYDCGSSAPCPSGNNGKGRRTGMGDQSGSAAWTYDARGRVTQETKSINGAGTFATQYTYDATDRVVDMTYPDGEVVHHDYNAAGSLDSLTGAAPYVQNAAYNAMGQITALPLGNGVTTNYTYYDLNFRLQSIEVPGLLDLAYTYDDVGNVLSITDARNHDQVQSFRYDSLDRLTHAWTTGGGEGAYDRTYTYDEIGNLTFKTDLGTYTYPVSGAESVRPHAVTNTSSGDEFTYDANGNQTLRVVVSGTQVITYVQDFAENRLQSVTVGGHTTKFTYDGDGNRVLRVSPDGTWTAYVGQYYEVSLPPWSIAGTVQDGPRSSPLEGIAVQLWGLNGSEGEHLATATTDANGSFAFDEPASCGDTLCWLGFEALEIREMDPSGYESHRAIAASGGTVISANTIRFSTRGNYSGNRFEDKRLAEWRFDGHVERETGAGLAGVRVTLLKDESEWRQVDADTTTSSGAFSLGYSSYSEGVLSFRVEEHDLTCYRSVSASSPNLEVVSANLLQGDGLTAGTYVGQRFTDEHYASPNLGPPSPAGCVQTLEAGSRLTFQWDTTCGWEWDTYAYTLTELKSGTVVTQGQTAGGSSGQVSLVVEWGMGYRFEVSGERAGYDPVTRMTRVQVAYPAPTNLRPSGIVEAGTVVFSWDSVAAGVQYRYALMADTCRSIDEEGRQQVPSVVQGMTDEPSVELELTGGCDYYFSVAVHPCGLPAGTTVQAQAPRSIPGPTPKPGFTPTPPSKWTPKPPPGPVLERKESLVAADELVPATVTPTPTPTPTRTPRPTPTCISTPRPTPTCISTPRPTPTCVPTPTRTPIPTPTPLPTPPPDAIVTKYYYVGAQQVAVRQDGELTYLHADHLGSTSLATNDTGGFVSRVLYYPYGETRYAEGTLPTDRLYTGQRWEQGFGLYDYHARYYDPALGRFISADTIVPNPGNPQDLNRYAYVRNNPLRHTDPSGHCIPGYNCPGDKGQNDPIVGGIWTPPPPSHEGPGRWVPQEQRDEARKCILGAAIFDTLATVVSLWGAELEFGVAIVVASSDGPLPVADIAGPLAGVVAYQKTLGKVENWLGLASGVNTIAADILGGYTYIDDNTEYGLPEIVIGQKTVEDLTAGLDSQLLGLVISEAFVDTVINASQALDNWMYLGGMNGDPTWELRVTWDGGWYTKHYDNNR